MPPAPRTGVQAIATATAPVTAAATSARARGGQAQQDLARQIGLTAPNT